MHRIRVNLLPLVEKYRQYKFHAFHKKFFDIKKEEDLKNLPQNFILFALQVTPETSINSLEPYFIDQVRAIDLIRLNMPNGFYLVVKEHPSMKGLRKTSFYKELRKKAGIILVSPDVDTKALIEKAKLIATITGTIGFEAWMMDKPALLFGPSFFSHLVYRYDSYRNFKQALEKMIFEHQPMSKSQKIVELAKIYNISFPTVVHDPLMCEKVMEVGNIKNFVKGLLEHINRLKTYQRKNV